MPTTTPTVHGGDPQARKTHTTADVRDEASPSTRELSSSPTLTYVPSKSATCEACSICKQKNAETFKCKKACHLCPDAVVVASEKVLSLAVDGITTTQYVRRAAAEQDEGRALAGGDYGNGVDIVQSGTTIFDGTYRGGEGKGGHCFLFLQAVVVLYAKGVAGVVMNQRAALLSFCLRHVVLLLTLSFHRTHTCTQYRARRLLGWRHPAYQQLDHSGK